jgi:hypothetical protein
MGGVEMKVKLLVAVLVGVLVGGIVPHGWRHGINLAQGASAPQPDVAALRAELDALKSLVPDQAHVMADVDYHVSNLWFAAQNTNWPLATFYLDEAKSHLNWAVRVRPRRRLSSGQELDLRPILQGVEKSSLAQLKAALDRQDLRAFVGAYRTAIGECYACHTAAEKPYLRLHVPESPASRMIDYQSKAD